MYCIDKSVLTSILQETQVLKNENTPNTRSSSSVPLTVKKTRSREQERMRKKALNSQILKSD